ncbi:Adenylate kinase isoenzyme [Ooceraea biroi]|nr:Adenylate kinase isoenzyme [Ooceraea biroi]
MGICFGKRKDDGIPRKDPVDTTALKQSESLIIFVIGGPGAGKFTLGRRLAARYGFQFISPSDILRSEVDSGSERGRRFEEIMRQGRHVPADVIVQLVEEKMMTQPNAVGYLVVDFPRDRRQAIAFNKEVRQPDLVLKLDARQLILVRRMRDRAAAAARFDDDTPEIVCKRIKKYFETDAGAVKPNKKVMTILDAEEEENKVFEAACAVVDRLIDAEHREA